MTKSDHYVEGPDVAHTILGLGASSTPRSQMDVHMAKEAVVFPSKYDESRVAFFLQGLQIVLTSLAFIFFPRQLLRFFEPTLLLIQRYTAVVRPSCLLQFAWC